MDCTTCGLEIDGGRYAPDAILVAQSTQPGFTTYRPNVAGGEDIRHAHCVDDPAHLHSDQFQKWAASRITQERNQRSQHQLGVRDQLAIIDRALRALPQDLIRAYIREMDDAEISPDS